LAYDEEESEDLRRNCASKCHGQRNLDETEKKPLQGKWTARGTAGTLETKLKQKKET